MKKKKAKYEWLAYLPLLALLAYAWLFAPVQEQQSVEVIEEEEWELIRWKQEDVPGEQEGF